MPSVRRVSYIIATFNRAAHLRRALENAREFVTADDELLVMDGGSSDDTAAVIEVFRDIVTHFVSERDFGEAHALNKGLLLSCGRYVKFLTDDDRTYPDAMRQVIDLLEAEPAIEALICGGEEFVCDAAGNETFSHRFHLPERMQLNGNLEAVCGPHVCCGLGMVLRRSVLARTGLLDTSMRAVDTDYMARLLTCGANVKYCHVALFRHVEYPHSGVQHKSRMLLDSIRVEIDCRLRDLAKGLIAANRAATNVDSVQIQCDACFEELARRANWLRIERRGILLRCLWWSCRFCAGISRLLPGLANSGGDDVESIRAKYDLEIFRHSMDALHDRLAAALGRDLNLAGAETPEKSLSQCRIFARILRLAEQLRARRRLFLLRCLLSKCYVLNGISKLLLSLGARPAQDAKQTLADPIAWDASLRS